MSFERLDHLLLEVSQTTVLRSPSRKRSSRSMSSRTAPCGIFVGARRGALLDRVEQARPEEPPARRRLADLQVTGAELERLLQERDRFLQLRRRW